MPCTLIGIDFSETVQQYNRGIFPDDLWLVRDVCDTRLASAIADMVVSHAVAEHLNDPEHLVAEMWRVLRPGGMFLLGIPLQSVRPDHVKLYEWKDVLALVQSYGGLLETVQISRRAYVMLRKGD